MEDRRQHARPVSRGDLEYTVEFALHKARELWPTKQRSGDHDSLKSMTRAVIDHLDLCDMRAFRRPPMPDRVMAAVGDTVRAWAGSATATCEEMRILPVARKDLEFTIGSALCRARRLWPKRRMPDGHSRLGPVARKVVHEMETSCMSVLQELPEAPLTPGSGHRVGSMAETATSTNRPR